MRSALLTLGLICGLGGGACAAQDFVAVKDEAEFNALLAGMELRMPIFQLSLQVTPDGRIAGSAMGWDITGQWDWKDGYFCRDMDWSGMAIPMNCQLVEVRGTDQMRFTVDKGAGDSAVLRLR